MKAARGLAGAVGDEGAGRDDRGLGRAREETDGGLEEERREDEEAGGGKGAAAEGATHAEA